MDSQREEAMGEAQRGRDARAALSDTILEGSHNWLVLRTKLKIAYNALRNIRGHLYLHAIAGFGLMGFLLFIGTGMFYIIFRHLMSQLVFGGLLMDRLTGIVFLIFFSMLLFSNLIIILSTAYLSKEVEFLMGLPLSRQAIFRQKLIESIVYSSWAFALLSLPLFISYGMVRGAPWYFYPLIVLLIIPFLTIPASLGAIVTMILTALLPARKTRTLCVVLGFFSLGLSFVIARVSGLSQLLRSTEDDFLQIMNVLGIGASPVLPSTWLANALQAIAPSDPADINLKMFLYWLAMLLATGLFLLEVARWLVPVLYYRGWVLSRDAAVKEVESHAKFSPFRFIDRQLETRFSAPTAGMLSKDLKTFWRDPSQWTQLVILVVLMLIYMAYVGGTQKYSARLAYVVADWRLVMSFFNLAATCFILSILTTRFIYPMLSLEGRGFWTVGLAPIQRSLIVWQKYILCLVLCVCVSIPLILMSLTVLQIQGGLYWLSIGTALVMSTALSSMSVGIGAILPDFKEDNPARIANGVGGTLNVLLSLAYIAATVAMIVVPTVMLGGSGRAETFARTWLYPYVAAVILIQVLVIWLPMRIGLRRWEKLEF